MGLPIQKRLSVTLDAELHKQIRIYAAHSGCSMNDIAVRALKEYLQRCSKCGYEFNDFS